MVLLPHRCFAEQRFRFGVEVGNRVDAASELGQVVQEENVGWITPPDDVDRFVAAVLQARRDRAGLQSMSERARRAAREKYSYEAVMTGYRRLFASLFAPSSAEAVGEATRPPSRDAAGRL